METTKITDGMIVRTADLERICERYDPRSVEYACFLLHGSKGDPVLAARRAVDGMFWDPDVQAKMQETAACVQEVAVAAYSYSLGEAISQAIQQADSEARPSGEGSQ